MTETDLLLSFREKLALWVAPWLYVPYREDREEAFRDLAEIAYGSRDAVWTSPRTLVRSACVRERDLLRCAASELETVADVLDRNPMGFPTENIWSLAKKLHWHLNTGCSRPSPQPKADYWRHVGERSMRRG